MALDKPFKEINADDLQALIDNSIPESRSIDYKSSLPGRRDEDKREFLGDVSSFANASGGHLVYGMIEEKGLPTSFSGMSINDPDAEKLRLENLLRDCVMPRLQGIQVGVVQLPTGAQAFIIRVPTSWNKPHVVEHGNHWRFYSRNSSGKYPLDVLELRSLFLQSGTVTERIRLFRDERLGSIVADQTPVPMELGARMVLHLIPIASAESPKTYALGEAVQLPHSVTPIGGQVGDRRYNLDGFLVAAGEEGRPNRAYTQIFRNGIIEAVDCGILGRLGTQKRIHSRRLELDLIKAVFQYLEFQQKIAASAPIAVSLSFVGVRDYSMAVFGSLNAWGQPTYTIDRDTIICPDILLDAFPVDQETVARALKPAFDAVWNSTGWPESMNYGKDGEWGKGENMRSA